MRYTNRLDSSREINFLKILKWKLLTFRKRDDKYSNLNIKYDKDKLSSKDDFICWLGHATVLLQLNQKRVLIDPVFGDIPFYKRKVKFPYDIKELGKIDVVLISHAHYDHFDVASVKNLISQKPSIIAPLGFSGYIKKIDKNIQVIELDWYKSCDIDAKLSITLTPAKHWSRRGIFDTNRALWGGFVIKSDKKTIFYAGDSAYDRHFKEIGEKVDIDIAILPIGAYKPEFIMKTNHLNPKEAYRAFLDLKAKKMMPVHYGTFKLSDEPVNEPKRWICDIKKETNGKIGIYDIGEVTVLISAAFLTMSMPYFSLSLPMFL
jgi:L-ascorbate metabolism protein UlaG (beta-lactamase superfamily)